ncbi:MAG: hypothetical protein GVY11_07625 [Gammaproteobacteria bacterium]|nr:hypothetical protein [Gammaproteobacteria bacterium]
MSDFHRIREHIRLLRAGLFVIPLLGASGAAGASEPGRFHLGVYGGKAAEDRLLEIVTRYNTGFIDSRLIALAPSWIHGEGKNIRREIEGQIVRHWGLQDHWEFNLAYVLRWMNFPWDRYVDTRFAVGGGVSWATEVPFIEPRAKELGREESTRLLGYLLVEWEFAPPRDSQWSGFIRLHHRSGAKGIFDDVNGGSNFVTLGMRYRFD